jgi:hypothetical protein
MFDDMTFRGEGNLLTPRRVANLPFLHILCVMDNHLLIFDPPDKDTTWDFKEWGCLLPGRQNGQSQ